MRQNPLGDAHEHVKGYNPLEDYHYRDSASAPESGESDFFMKNYSGTSRLAWFKRIDKYYSNCYLLFIFSIHIILVKNSRISYIKYAIFIHGRGITENGLYYN